MTTISTYLIIHHSNQFYHEYLSSSCSCSCDVKKKPTTIHRVHEILERDRTVGWQVGRFVLIFSFLHWTTVLTLLASSWHIGANANPSTCLPALTCFSTKTALFFCLVYHKIRIAVRGLQVPLPPLVDRSLVPKTRDFFFSSRSKNYFFLCIFFSFFKTKFRLDDMAKFPFDFGTVCKPLMQVFVALSRHQVHMKHIHRHAWFNKMANFVFALSSFACIDFSHHPIVCFATLQTHRLLTPFTYGEKPTWHAWT